MTDEAKNPYDVFTKKCPRCLGCQKLHPDYDGTVLHPDGHETKELDLQTDWNKSDSCIHCQKNRMECLCAWSDVLCNQCILDVEIDERIREEKWKNQPHPEDCDCPEHTLSEDDIEERQREYEENAANCISDTFEEEAEK